MKSPSRTEPSNVLRATVMTLVLSAALVGGASAQNEPVPDATASTAPSKTSTQSTTTDLVAAAKASKQKRGTSGRKKITNADVKKAGGKLIFISEAPMPEADKPKGEYVPVEERDQARYKARREALDRVSAAEKAVEELSIELVRAEQIYYESNDPAHRDTTLKARFEDTKGRLETAKGQLSEAKEALAAIEPPPDPPAQ